ncbi:unnamed protein product [Periconia digitata]|uniref:Uncharacterized protein n=1 Tax=Periconia digitata TaxID=1303443 RepID=A0A9W4XWR0_9PLEO|nr:unnamed protein product [Periconia digitata]
MFRLLHFSSITVLHIIGGWTCLTRSPPASPRTWYFHSTPHSISRRKINGHVYPSFVFSLVFALPQLLLEGKNCGLNQVLLPNHGRSIIISNLSFTTLRMTISGNMPTTNKTSNSMAQREPDVMNSSLAFSKNDLKATTTEPSFKQGITASHISTRC